MRKGFTFNDIEFVVIATMDVIDTEKQTEGYSVQVQFMDGRPANHKPPVTVSFDENDFFLKEKGYTAVQQIMHDEQMYVEEGNYYGSPTYNAEDFK